MKKQFKLQLMGAVAVAILATTAASCSPQPREFATDQPTRICVDDQGMRQDESQCANRRVGVRPLYNWYYVGRGGYVPATGYRVHDGAYTPSPATTYQTAAVAEHTAVTRGGFGASSSRASSVSRGGFGGSGHASASS